MVGLRATAAAQRICLSATLSKGRHSFPRLLSAETSSPVSPTLSFTHRPVSPVSSSACFLWFWASLLQPLCPGLVSPYWTLFWVILAPNFNPQPLTLASAPDSHFYPHSQAGIIPFPKPAPSPTLFSKYIPHHSIFSQTTLVLLSLELLSGPASGLVD